MADSKTTALTELTTFSGDETFYVVEDDDGTPVSRRVTVENLAAGLAARTEFSGTYAPLKGPGTLLARTIYSANDTSAVTGTTLADLDASNLAVTFTAPPSGNVEVHLHGAGGNSSSYAAWGLREGSSQVGTIQALANQLTVVRLTAIVTVTGLTPGALHTYKWAAKSYSAGGTHTVYTGGNGGVDGDAIMSVYAIA